MSCHASTNFLPVSPSTACSHCQDSVTSGGSYFDYSSEFFTGPSAPCIDQFNTDFQFRDCSIPTFMPEPRSMPIIHPCCLSYNFTEPPTIPNTPSEINSELSIALSIHSDSTYENYQSSLRGNSDFQNETADESFQYAIKSPCCNDSGCIDLRDTDSIPGQCSYPTSPPDTQSASTSVETNFHVSSNEICCDTSTISTITTSSQTTLNSSSILTELPSNLNPSFLLDMSNWQRDLEQFTRAQMVKHSYHWLHLQDLILTLMNSQSTVQVPQLPALNQNKLLLVSWGRGWYFQNRMWAGGLHLTSSLEKESQFWGHI